MGKEGRTRPSFADVIGLAQRMLAMNCVSPVGSPLALWLSVPEDNGAPMPSSTRVEQGLS